MSRTTCPFGRGAGIAGAPRRKFCQRVRPADPDYASVDCLPAVAAPAHPMICVCQSDTADAVLAGERDGPGHALVSIQIAGTALSVPALQRPERFHDLGLRIDNNDPAVNHAKVLGKAVQSVRVDSVAAGFSEEPCGKSGALLLGTQVE